MKSETTKRIWKEVEAALISGQVAGNSFKLEFNSIDQACIRTFNNQMWLIPQGLIERLGGKVKDLIESYNEKAKARSIATMNRLKVERLEREKRLDEPGFVLLAGENTDIVFSGTWRECRNNLWRLNCKQDNGEYLPKYDNGIGCWVIVKGDFEAESGKFDNDMYW